jgi:hypothetical protein
MPSGGARPGAGRPRKPIGAYEKTRRRRARDNKITTTRAVNALMKEGIQNPFPGDAHAFLVYVYKNENADPQLRLEAARAAIGYERPRLATTSVTMRRPSEMSDDELAAAAADAEAEADALEALLASAKNGDNQTTH